MFFRSSVILIIISIFLYIYWRLKKTFSYFQRHGVPYIKPGNWILGNMTDIFLRRKTFIEGIHEFYAKLDPHKFGGVYQAQQATFFIRDPEIIKNVLIKDFEHFQDRNPKLPNDEDLFAQTLFSLKGEMWKNLRIKLTGTFTSGKMKNMFPLVNDCGKNLHDLLTTTPAEEAFEMKSLMSRFTIDVIGSCAFGIETECLTNPNSEFHKMAKQLIKFNYKAFIPMIWKNMPKKLIKLLDISFVNKESLDFFVDIIAKTIQYREKNNVSRYDFLDSLIALKNNTVINKYQDRGEKEDLEKFMAQIGGKLIKSDVEMTLELLAAQCFLFFFAGYETSSTTLSFLLLELAQNHDIQKKVRYEIKGLLETYGTQVTYDLLKNMPYTDMAIAETLRKYPGTGLLVRECTQSYKIPNTEVIIPAGTPVMIPIVGLHNDAKYYEKPDEFYPEHFTSEAKTIRPNCTYLPFGDGPRVCIAERFAKMSVKVGLIYMLKDFTYHVSPKMKFPIKLDKNSGIIAVEGGIWLHRKRK